jgi:uncharacterized membrane protein
LENRIRGWLLKEPTLPKAPAKIDFQINQQILPLRQRIDRRGWVLIFAALFFILVPVGYSILMFPKSPFSVLVFISGIIGASFVLVFISYQYGRLNHLKNKQHTPELKA